LEAEAEAIGVEAEAQAVDEIEASTSLVCGLFYSLGCVR